MQLYWSLIHIVLEWTLLLWSSSTHCSRIDLITQKMWFKRDWFTQRYIFGNHNEHYTLNEKVKKNVYKKVQNIKMIKKWTKWLKAAHRSSLMFSSQQRWKVAPIQHVRAPPWVSYCCYIIVLQGLHSILSARHNPSQPLSVPTASLFTQYSQGT